MWHYCTLTRDRTNGFRNVFVAKNVHLSNCIIGDDGHINEDITVYEAAVLNIRQ